MKKKIQLPFGTCSLFLVIMICFNKFGYIISYLAYYGPLVMGNNGTMVVYEFLMSHLNLVSAILYLMVLPIPALWLSCFSAA